MSDCSKNMGLATTVKPILEPPDPGYFFNPPPFQREVYYRRVQLQGTD